jgi:hypothetical protein
MLRTETESARDAVKTVVCQSKTTRLAVVGDLYTVALVSKKGSIDWCCLSDLTRHAFSARCWMRPKWDVFASLLGIVAVAVLSYRAAL